MLRGDKVDALYDFVNPYVEFSDKEFQIRSKFPNRAYEINESQTLE